MSDLLAPSLPLGVSQQKKAVKPLGVPEAIRFRRPDSYGFDEFTLVYPDHTLLVGIMLDSDGKFIDLIGPDPA